MLFPKKEKENLIMTQQIPLIFGRILCAKGDAAV